MSWQQQPYNPSYSQAGQGGYGQPPRSTTVSYSQPYNPGYTSQPPPTQSFPPEGYSQYSHGPPPTQSIPPGGYSHGPPPTQSIPPGGYSHGPPPTQSIPPGGYSHAPPPHIPSQSLPPGAQGGGYRGPNYVQTVPGAPPGPPAGVDPELYSWFQSVDADNSGKITATELRQALLNNNWTHFNEETCRILIGMFDANKDGTIDVYEFVALWKYIQEWRQCFNRFDTDGSGNIDATELQQALSAFGYRLSPNFCTLCTRMFDRTDKRTMKFDDFIQCCVMLRSLTDSFKRMDVNRSGTITVSYEQFLEMAIDNTIS